MNSKIQIETLLSVFEIFPTSKLINECVNDSQIEYLLFLKEYFLAVREYMSNYFLGNQMASMDLADSLSREEIEHQVKKWLCLYDLIQWGWSYLEDEAKLKGVLIGSSPGEVFRSIIQNHVEGLFAIHQANHYEFSSRKSQKQLRLILKAQALLDQRKEGSPLTDEIKDIVNEIKRLDQKGEEIGSKFNYLYYLCISAFNRNKDKRRIKKKYQEYQALEGEEERLLLKIWHPSKKAQSWKVINQEIYETS
jgi:HEPN domain-containing protein